MNFGEKLLRSAYGRPFFEMITGMRVPTNLYCDVHDVLVIDKGIVDASIKDIQHTFCCYEVLQKELHQFENKNLNTFTDKLSTEAQKLVEQEQHKFGRCFSEVVIRVINSIAESKAMRLTVAQIREMAMRPASQFFQNKGGKIKKSVRENRMRQAAIAAALLMVNRGVATIVSTLNFSTQN